MRLSVEHAAAQQTMQHAPPTHRTVVDCVALPPYTISSMRTCARVLPCSEASRYLTARRRSHYMQLRLPSTR
jgi:hypothetical protein